MRTVGTLRWSAPSAIAKEVFDAWLESLAWHAQPCMKLKHHGFYKGKLRTGACDYCASYDLHEQPLTERIVVGFIERVRSMKSDCWDAWLQHVATANDCHLFTAANFERAGSPSYWEKCFQFLPQHCDPEGP